MEQKSPQNSAKNPNKESQILLQWWATVTPTSTETIINCIQYPTDRTTNQILSFY